MQGLVLGHPGVRHPSLMGPPQEVPNRVGSYDSYTHWPPDCDLVKSLGQMRHHVLLGFKSLHELPVGSTSSLVHIQGKWIGNV